MNQNEIWINHIKNLTAIDVVNDYNKPAIFQKELSDYINSYLGEYEKVIEVGCETGVTSFLLNNHFNKTLLDLNPNAIALAQEAAVLLNKNAKFVIGDMFKMDFQNNSFDLLFNAGVIEHFKKEERILALLEYSRVLRSKGKMIICYPNHYCTPYRFSYIVLRLFRRWPYPSEYRIYDLKEEIDLVGLVLEQRLTMSKKTIFNWLNFTPFMKSIFRMLDKLLNYEGYLTVLVIAKK
jgi:ubiquinone/menaquinone biosynthesis C-methylase UbiE